MRNKKWLIGLLAILMLILAACGGGDENLEDTPPTTTPTATSPLSPITISTPDTFSMGGEIVNIDAQTLSPGEGQLALNISMPEGYKFNNLAPFKGEFSSSNDTSVSIAPSATIMEEVEPKLPITIPLLLAPGEATLTLDLDIYWCEAVNETLCFVAPTQVIVPITVAADGITTQANAEVVLVPPVIQ
jgi:hypothetical protein